LHRKRAEKQRGKPRSTKSAAGRTEGNPFALHRIHEEVDGKTDTRTSNGHCQFAVIAFKSTSYGWHALCFNSLDFNFPRLNPESEQIKNPLLQGLFAFSVNKLRLASVLFRDNFPWLNPEPETNQEPATCKHRLTFQI
jgi:hypothetical protein